MKKQLLLVVSLCAGFVACAAADSRVAVYSPGQSQPVVLTGIDNLRQLTLDPKLAGRTWWPGTVIAESLATAVQQDQQRQLLARLSALSADFRQDNDLDLADTVDRVRGQLAALTVTGRQFVSLDADEIRLQAGANRRLVGDYSLYLLAKPTSVHIFGAVTPTGAQPFLVSRDADDYLLTHQRLSGAEKSYAWVILPNGQAKSVPVAYWNRRHNEVAPGSAIYVGFSSWSLPRAYQDINEKIVSLLTHRIPD